MPEQNLGEKSKKIYDILFDLQDSDRANVVRAALSLFGQGAVNLGGGKGHHDELNPELKRKNSFSDGSAKEFFAEKKPENRGELLAAGARYLELNQDKEVLTKEDFHSVFKDARRPFDSKNFARDIGNAIHNAKFFMSGGKPKTYKLTYHGQEYIDALPNRESIKESVKPRTNKKKKSVTSSKE